jgi:CBS domain-containing protein
VNTKALDDYAVVPAIYDLKTLVAADVMTESVISVDADWSVSQLAEFFLENGISGAPVVSSEKGLIGVVSHTDIVRHSTQSLDEPDQTHDYYLGILKSKLSSEDMLGMHLDASDDTKVTDIMTSMVFQVEAKTPIVEIAEMMTRGRIHRVFVIREDEVLGVITALDLIKMMCGPVD